MVGTRTPYRGVGMRGFDGLQLEGLQVVEMAMESFWLTELWVAESSSAKG